MGFAWKIALVVALLLLVVPFVVILVSALNGGYSRQEARVEMN